MTRDDLDRLLSDHYEQEPPLPLPASADQLLSRSRRPRRLAVAAALALGGLAVAVAMVATPPSELTMRGAGQADVALEWVVDGSGARPGGAVGLQEAVAFRVTTTESGYLCLDELGQTERRVFPAEGQAWRTEGGRVFPESDGRVQAWRTDDGPGARTYRVTFDRDDPGCGSPAGQAQAEVRWVP